MATTTAVPAVTPTPVTTATTAVATAATATTSTPVESATTTAAAAAATSAAVPVTPTPITTFEEIQKQLKNTLDHVEQRNMVSGFQTLSKATGAVVDHCEQLGNIHTYVFTRYPFKLTFFFVLFRLNIRRSSV
jgi:hypothetical protein